MFNKLALAVVLISIVLVTNPARAAEDCSKALPKRLIVGQKAMVTKTQSPVPTIFRSEPGVGSQRVTSLNDGDEFLVIGDAGCHDGGWWWKVKVNNKEAFGLESGVYRGKDPYYFLGPVYPEWEATSKLQVNSRPTLLSDVIGATIKGRTYYFDGRNAGGWVRITTDIGLFGWVCGVLTPDQIKALPVVDNSKEGCG